MEDIEFAAKVEGTDPILFSHSHIENNFYFITIFNILNSHFQMPHSGF